jgi:hypothetical protein
MELALNLFWVGLAIFLAELWLRHTPASTKNRRVQYIALALILLILLPAVSMTDDLLAAQNPCEVDSSLALRGRHDWTPERVIILPAFALLFPIFRSVSPQLQNARAADAMVPTLLRDPATASINNRPPPAA